MQKKQPDRISQTCNVTSLSSTMISLVKKSAPIVALYCELNFWLTNWLINDVLPTLHRNNHDDNNSSKKKYY